MSQLLEGLNPAQRDAVTNYETPSLIIAGAGSGKTRVLTARIGYMLENGVDPHSILALTFTKKAATQMKERLFEMIDHSKAHAIARSMGTFHSIFGRIIGENADLLGYTSSFTTYGSSESKSLIKSITKELQLDDAKYKPGLIASRISFAKNSLVTPEAYVSNEAFVLEDRTMQIPQFARIYGLYCARCKAANALDYDDYLLQTNFLFRDHPDVLARYQEKFQYILVDEYQDTNYAQYIIIRRLAQKHSRVCVVGDDAQSIYSFRGAKIENIINFRSHFPTAKTFKLEQNYRSTQTIVNAANSVIAHNSNRLEKRCFSAGAVGEKVTIMRSFTDRDEAYSIAESISRRVRDCDAKWSEFAVLYRNNSQAQNIEQALRQRAIPYQVHKGNSFFEQKEVKDVLGYIRLIINPKDDDAFKRIVNYPTRGIGNTTVERIEAIAQERRVSMWEAAEQLVATPPADARQKAVATKIKDFVALITGLSAERETHSLYNFGHTVASKSGILPLFSTVTSAENQTAIDNIEELLNTMQIFNDQFMQEVALGERSEDETPSVEEWLQSVMLLTDQDNGGAEEDENSSNKVTLMTVHTSKGLEYEYIYIAGVEHNLFPSQRAFEAGEIEEERRLFYVALTRAKIAATVSFCDTRYQWGTMIQSKASLFINEIDKKYVEMDDGSSVESAIRPRASAYDAGTKGAPGQNQRFNRPFIRGERNLSAPQYNERENRERIEMQRAQKEQREAIERKVQSMRSLGARKSEAANDDITMPWDNKPQQAQQSQQPQQNNVSSSGSGKFQVGDRITHEKFGAGRITDSAMVGDNEILTIDFEAMGTKKIVAGKAPMRHI
ncbi:MAG: UvrD-helicase domain-containing protein [Rikenellaceae bacterium]